jgi:hypothetical protein
MIGDYLDAYVLKNERDEAVEIIRKCHGILIGYQPPGGDEKDLVRRLLEILDGPESGRFFRRNDKFISRVS